MAHSASPRLAGWGPSSSSPSQHGIGVDAARARSARSGHRRPLGRRPADLPAPLTRQLRERLDTQPPRTPVAGRNPFVFGARRAAGRDAAIARSRAGRGAAARADAVAAAGAADSSCRELRRASEDGATVLTAIINDNGALAFVKTGDKLLERRHASSRVEETGVVIVDAAGITQTLRLP